MKFMPIEFTFIQCESPDARFKVDDRVCAGHMTDTDMFHYVEGKELAPVGYVVKFTYFRLYSDFGGPIPGHTPFSWTLREDGTWSQCTKIQVRNLRP